MAPETLASPKQEGLLELIDSLNHLINETHDIATDIKSKIGTTTHTPPVSDSNKGSEPTPSSAIRKVKQAIDSIKHIRNKLSNINNDL